MELRLLVRFVWRWLWLIMLCMAGAGVAAYFASKQLTPIYQAATVLLIDQSPTSSATPDLASLTTSERLARTYVELLRRRPVMEEVIANLNLSMSPGELAEQVRVIVLPDTQLILLTVDNSSPQQAAAITNEIVEVFRRQNQERQTSRYASSIRNLEEELALAQSDITHGEKRLEELDDTIDTPANQMLYNRQQELLSQNRSRYTTILEQLETVRLAESQHSNNLDVVESALPPAEPIRPTPLRNALLAALFGAMLATGIALLMEYLDDSVKSAEDVEHITGVSALASIARIPPTQSAKRLVATNGAYSPIAEAYRVLRTSLEFSAVDVPIQTLVVTSSSPAEGKSTTAANLAIVIAQTGRRVLLVDADLRRPTLHVLFNCNQSSGMTNALVRKKDELIDTYIQTTEVENLHLLTSGPLPPNPAELLGSGRMRMLLDELRTQADVIIFDSPPLLAVVDASLLAHICDAVLLVVLAGVTRTSALKRSKEQLVQSGTRIAGTVFNRVSSAYSSDYGYSYRGYYGYGEQRRSVLRLRTLKKLPFARNGKAHHRSNGRAYASERGSAEHQPPEQAAPSGSRADGEMQAVEATRIQDVSN